MSWETLSAAKKQIFADFADSLSFPLDDFQVEACAGLAAGNNVLLAAPTGSGKTILGQFACALALNSQKQVYYTTPIKALSNQKHEELAQIFGARNVGLLTGDTSWQHESPIVVMTTEVLRNMLYSDDGVPADLHYLVMDEIHYLADRSRGPVWEEVLINLPARVQTVGLSATVSNAEQLGEWLDEIRGHTKVVISEDRPVPLTQHMMVQGQIYDLHLRPGRPQARSRQSNQALSSDVDTRGLRLPKDLAAAISRVSAQRREKRSSEFSRHGDKGYGSGSHRGRNSRRRKDGGGQGRNRRHVSARNYRNSSQHRRPSSYRGGGIRMSRGDIAAVLESNSLLPAISFIFSRKQCDLAVQQLLRSGVRLQGGAVSAQVRQIVQERLQHLSAQDKRVLGFERFLAGAMRGFAAHHAGLIPAFRETVEHLFAAGLLQMVYATETLALGINMPARTVVLESLVKYNGVAHVPLTPGEYTQLTGRAGRRGIDTRGHAVIIYGPRIDPLEAGGLAQSRTYPVQSSFVPTSNMTVNLLARLGQDRSRKVLGRSFAQFQHEAETAELAQTIAEYQEAESGFAAAMSCDSGDFFEFSRLREKLNRLEKKSAHERRFSHDPGSAELLSRFAQQIAGLRAQLQAHPCQTCPERENHARWGQRYWKARRERTRAESHLQSRRHHLVRVFDNTCVLLTELGYVQDSQGELPAPARSRGSLQVTATGQVLRRLYSERDLVVAEMINQGNWDHMLPQDLAAAVSLLVVNSRPLAADRWQFPSADVRLVAQQTMECWEDLSNRQEKLNIPVMPPPEGGLLCEIYDWADGAFLPDVLNPRLSAGDFLRAVGMVIDLLEHIRTVVSGPLARTAGHAAALLRRDLVLENLGSSE